ncbi:MAG: bactofilin family protein [Candidatus Cyclobacteriaceae bacterium M2_1C_046]
MLNTKKDQKVAQEISTSSNTIGKGTVVEGTIETFGNIRIEGKIIGDVKTKSKVVIGQSAVVEGNILAQNADIEGELNGNVEISELLTLKPTAVINGDITTNKLLVESGASFNGGCKMGVSIKEIKIGANEEPGNTARKEEEKRKVG